MSAGTKFQTTPGATDSVAERLATLVHLERRARGAGNLVELGFIMVNETLGLVQGRQCMLLGRSRGGQELLKLSGVAEAASDAPFRIWLHQVLRYVADQGGAIVRAVTSRDLPAALAADWAGWLPDTLIVVSIRRGDLDFGILAIARAEPANEVEIRALSILAEAYAHAWESLAQGGKLKPAQLRSPRRRALLWAATLAVVVLAFLPVPSSVLAPAEVIAAQPATVRSALDGVVDRILVRPNQDVVEGQILVQLDGRRLQAQLQAARMAVAATEVELRQARQAAVTDPRGRAQIPALQGRLDHQSAEMRFLESQEERLVIRASRAGIAIFDNAHEWIGRPVMTGERIMEIADPARMELEIRLPAADAIQFPENAKVLFFRNVDPRQPNAARLSFVGYRAVPGADGIVAYRLKATFEGEDVALRIGLKGTAKVYGPPVSLGYYILRRPLASARVVLGL